MLLHPEVRQLKPVEFVAGKSSRPRPAVLLVARFEDGLRPSLFRRVPWGHALQSALPSMAPRGTPVPRMWCVAGSWGYGVYHNLPEARGSYVACGVVPPGAVPPKMPDKPWPARGTSSQRNPPRRTWSVGRLGRVFLQPRKQKTQHVGHLKIRRWDVIPVGVVGVVVSFRFQKRMCGCCRRCSSEHRRKCREHTSPRYLRALEMIILEGIFQETAVFHQRNSRTF